jgi:predicted dehydrogenase
MKKGSRIVLSRREFLQTSAAAATALALPAVSYGRILGANERINLGVIGTGGMGTHHVQSITDRSTRDNVFVTRVCDVYRRRLNNAIGIIGGPDTSGTMEYRELLGDKELDGVVIATPDHWHTKIAIEAMDAAKDVYVEKPLSHTIEQAIECRDAVKKTGRVLQVGPQGTSDGRYWAARQAIRQGRIGKVAWSQASYCRNSRGGQFNWQIDADAGPKQDAKAEGYVWWDRWLGHEWNLAPKIEWNADHFFRFRKYFAYNGGLATDLLYHKLAPLLLAISGVNGEYPKRVVATGGTFVEKDERDIPDTFMMMVDYPTEHSVVLVSVMTNDTGIDDVIRGQHGTMYFSGNFDTGTTGSSIRIVEQADWWPEFRKVNADEVQWAMKKNSEGKDQPEPGAGGAEFELAGAARPDHMMAFLNAIRGEGDVACNVELGCSTMVAIKMGVEAYRQSKVMLWDAEQERMVVG